LILILRNFHHKDDLFENVICLAVLEHLHNPVFFIREINRVTKKGGTIFLSTPNWSYSYKNFFDDYTHIRPYTKKSLYHIFEDNNFEQISILPGYRNKPFWMYKIPLAFLFASLLPFTNKARFVPNFLKGKATSLFAIAKK